MHPFFKTYGNNNFFQKHPLKPQLYTVVVQYQDGYRKEYHAIENPWQYITKIKTNPKVQNAWVKDEK